MTPWPNCALRQTPIGVSRGSTCPGRRAPCAKSEISVLRCNPDPGRSASTAQVGNGSAVVAATGGNQGHGGDGRRINDGDNYHNHNNEEVNIANIDPISPPATGMPEEGVNRR